MSASMVMHTRPGPHAVASAQGRFQRSALRNATFRASTKVPRNPVRLAVHCVESSSDAAAAADDSIRDELGAMAEQIMVVGKSVDQGLNGTSIFLVGMMGSGKSTVGKLLGNVLQYCFFDSDAVIEQAAGGASVSEIFAQDGEESFRDIESNVLRELAAYKNCVIATGGGAVMRSINWGAMNAGVTVYLKGSVDLLERRISQQDSGASRPMLSGGADAGEGSANMHEKLESLLELRTGKYASADCTVSIEGSRDLGASPTEIAYRVLLAIDKCIKDSAAEREQFQKVEIKNEGTIPVGSPMKMAKRNVEE